jgi:hypothetical protein
VYVNNFADPRKPRALCLPHGRAVELRDGMSELIRDLSLAIPALFESEEYKARRHSIDEAFEEAQEHAFEELQQKAESENFGLLRTPMGFMIAPLKDGKVIKPDVFKALDQPEREAIEAKLSDLQEDLKAVVERLPMLEKERRQRIREATSEFANSTVEQAIRQLAKRFEDVAAVQEYLTAVARDLVDNVDIFLKAHGAREESLIVAPDRRPTATLACGAIWSMCLSRPPSEASKGELRSFARTIPRSPTSLVGSSTFPRWALSLPISR